MKILKIILENTSIFGNSIEIDFVTMDGVRKSKERDNLKVAHKLKSGIYTQQVMAFVGLNATGKTTALEIIDLANSIVITHASLNEKKMFLQKLTSHNEEITMTIYLIHEKYIYRLKSCIYNDKGNFKYKNELLHSKEFALVKKEDLFDFTIQNINEVKREDELKHTKYLKEDDSIVFQLNTDIKNISLLPIVNFNCSWWTGRPPREIVKCFDPNIKEIYISQNKVGASEVEECTVSFINDKTNTLHGGNLFRLSDFLSSGTIKGLTIFPPMIDVLKHGGYLIVDEIENHLNKKIVEWLFDIFNDATINKNGACLIFSTHYPEILDSFYRKDNIFVLRRNEDLFSELVNYASLVKRNELQKSEIILSNYIKGTAPSYHDMTIVNEFLRGAVNEQ